MRIRSQSQVPPHNENKKINPKTLGTQLLSKAPHFAKKSKLAWQHYLLLILVPFALSGCAPKSLVEAIAPEPEAPVVKQKTVDYRWAECRTLSAFYDEGLNNALYWLRTIECTNRIMTTEAQRRASELVVNGWDDAFYKSILLERAGMSTAERRTQLVLLESYKLQFPSSMRVLLSNWIENQTLTLALAEERNRYRRLSTETDNRLDQLRKENASLEHELRSTMKKLENLTQIERQLSSRKQGASVEALSEETAIKASTTENSATEKAVIEKAEAPKVENNTAKPTKPESVKTEEVKPEPVKTETAKPTVEKPTETGSK